MIIDAIISRCPFKRTLVICVYYVINHSKTGEVHHLAAVLALFGLV